MKASEDKSYEMEERGCINIDEAAASSVSCLALIDCGFGLHLDIDNLSDGEATVKPLDGSQAPIGIETGGPKWP
ncbi:unnamed protein product [Soboliphyme baturini]|uniref:Uncharacterized protein n=1 Tax=Soboliphyme baturini TaxID=241478 RepID=A0A183IJX0_9BILA|nr:unnamed protein product [Soboliphyme baturini]